MGGGFSNLMGSIRESRQKASNKKKRKEFVAKKFEEQGMTPKKSLELAKKLTEQEDDEYIKQWKESEEQLKKDQVRSALKFHEPQPIKLSEANKRSMDETYEKFYQEEDALYKKDPEAYMRKLEQIRLAYKSEDERRRKEWLKAKKGGNKTRTAKRGFSRSRRNNQRKTKKQ
jgi:hypothetical protein